MATPNPDDEYDWNAAEADIVDLDAARRRRQLDGWSADIDDERDDIGDEPVPVDPADAPSPTGRSERRPIIPAWLKSRSEAFALARWTIGHYLYVSTYHLTRTPLYAGRLVFRAPRGMVRSIIGTARWLSDAEGLPVRLAAVRREDAEDYLRLSRQRDRRVNARILALLTALAIATAGGALMVIATPREIWYATLATLVGLLGLIGSSPDRPLVNVAAIKPRVRKLTADVLIRAFLAAGLCKPDDPITFPAPIMRDGPGWRAVIDLPYSVKADTAIKKRIDLAAGLDLDEVQVWPERVRGTAGSARRLSLWVADEDPYAKPSGL